MSKSQFLSLWLLIAEAQIAELKRTIDTERDRFGKLESELKQSRLEPIDEAIAKWEQTERKNRQLSIEMEDHPTAGLDYEGWADDALIVVKALKEIRAKYAEPGVGK